uniref:Exoribonuclease phosphorolytic domain-containing protein n=1 Tax=Ditylenchus dipsaci TaxID=166011 RepID=A0A915ELM0_9BILA
MPKVLATQRKFLERKDEIQGDIGQSRVLNGPVGSAYLEIGNTKVMCSVNGPKEQSGDFSADGSLNVFLHGMEPGTNIQFTIISALNAVVCLKKFSRAKIDIELNVIADDGGILAACIMAAGVALISANIECFDLALACNLLICDDGDRFILDPTLSQIRKHKEKGVTATIAIIPSLGQVVCTDVDGLIKKSTLDKVVRYGFKKCLEMYPLMSETLRSESGNLF